jgi:cell division protein FtsW
MTCAALGLLLRVSYELERAERLVAKSRGDAAQPVAAGLSMGAAPASALPRRGEAAARGTSRLHQRIEPSLGLRGGA